MNTTNAITARSKILKLVRELIFKTVILRKFCTYRFMLYVRVKQISLFSLLEANFNYTYLKPRAKSEE